jgi:Icc-related predicted phosphoesterase
VVVTHYSPIRETVEGEPAEILPYLGSSRLGEVIDLFGAELVIHGHAHHGSLQGKTTGGIPVYNVALTLLQPQGKPYRVFEV